MKESRRKADESDEETPQENNRKYQEYLKYDKGFLEEYEPPEVNENEIVIQKDDTRFDTQTKYDRIYSAEPQKKDKEKVNFKPVFK